MYLPVFASANATFSVTEVEKLEDLVFGHLVFSMLLVIIFVLVVLLAALTCQLLATVLFQDFEPAAKPLPFLLHEDSLLIESLFVEGSGSGLVWAASMVVLALYGSHRLAREVQRTQVNYSNTMDRSGQFSLY